MAASIRTVVTRLLPWAALAVMTVLFFVQVKARQRARAEPERARDEVNALHADRAMGLAPVQPPGPAPTPVAPRAAEGDDEAEVAALHRQLKAAGEDLAAAEAAQQALLADAERAAALRTTEAARANALEAQLVAATDAAFKRVAELEARIAEAKAQLERRESRVARWLALALTGTPDARAVVTVEAQQASDEDVAELHGLWREAGEQEARDAVATVLSAMPTSAAAAALAADIVLARPSPQDAVALLARLGSHALRVDVLARVLAEGGNALREAAVAAASTAAWSEADRERIGDALDMLLRTPDPATLEIAIRAVAKLGLRGRAAALLPFLTHQEPALRIATVYALLATCDHASAVRTLRPIVVDLLDDEAPDVRLAGLFLAQELAGERRSLAFGSSQEAVAQEIGRLKQKLATLAKD